jgi:hypothetical protein
LIFSGCVVNQNTNFDGCDNEFKPIGNETAITRLIVSTPLSDELILLKALIDVPPGQSECLLFQITRNGLSSCGLDGDEFEEFASWFDGAIRRNSSEYNSDEQILAALEEKEMLNFHPGIWKSDIVEGNKYVRHIDADGKVKLKALKGFGRGVFR